MLPDGLSSAIIIVGSGHDTAKINKIMESNAKRAIAMYDSTNEKEISHKLIKITGSSKPILPGLIADSIITSVEDAGIENAMVKIGFVFRGLGESQNGPWKVQIQDDIGTFASRALSVGIRDGSIAMLSQSIFNAISQNGNRPKCKGVVVITKDAASASALAYKAITLPASEGRDWLESLGYRGMLVDINGDFVKTKGF